MVEPLRHRQTKGAETDMPGLSPPRHIPTLPRTAVCCAGSEPVKSTRSCPSHPPPADGVADWEMVYRGGCGSRLDDECAFPSVTMSGSRSARPRASRKERSDGAFRWSGCVGEGNVGMRCRRCRQGDLGTESTDRAGR